MGWAGTLQPGPVGCRSVSFTLIWMFDKPREQNLFVRFLTPCGVSRAVPSAGNRAGNRLKALPSQD